MDVIIHKLYSPPVDDLWCNMNSVESNLLTSTRIIKVVNRFCSMARIKTYAFGTQIYIEYSFTNDR